MTCCKVIDRMTIFFRDGADGSPSGMRQRGFTNRLFLGKVAQDAICPDGVSQVRNIAAQFADDGKSLIGKRNTDLFGAAVWSGRNRNRLIDQITVPRPPL